MFSNGLVELDLAGDGHAVVGDGRRAELLVEDDVAALGAERHLDRVGEPVDAALEGATSGLVEDELLSHGVVSLLGSWAVGLRESRPDRAVAGASGQPSTTARMSFWLTMR